jgi:hypothetical protein
MGTADKRARERGILEPLRATRTHIQIVLFHTKKKHIYRTFGPVFPASPIFSHSAGDKMNLFTGR